MAAALNVAIKQQARFAPGEFLWENIWPRQGKDGAPKLNHEKGKYIVRLFHQGEWKMVTVDDFVPVEQQQDGRDGLIFPMSMAPGELWPQIFCKALCTVWRCEPPSRLHSAFLYSCCGWLEQSFDAITSHHNSNDENATDVAASVAFDVLLPAPTFGSSPIDGLLTDSITPAAAAAPPSTPLASSTSEKKHGSSSKSSKSSKHKQAAAAAAAAAALEAAVVVESPTTIATYSVPNWWAQLASPSSSSSSSSSLVTGFARVSSADPLPDASSLLASLTSNMSLKDVMSSDLMHVLAPALSPFHIPVPDSLAELRVLQQQSNAAAANEDSEDVVVDATTAAAATTVTMTSTATATSTVQHVTDQSDASAEDRTFSFVHVLPFVPAAMFSSAPLSLDGDDASSATKLRGGSGSRTRRSKTAATATPSKSSGKSKRSTKATREDERKRREQEKLKQAAEADEIKQLQEAFRLEEEVRRRGVLGDLTKLGPLVAVIDVLSCSFRIVTLADFGEYAEHVSILLNPTALPTAFKFQDVWTDVSRPFQPCSVYHMFAPAGAAGASTTQDIVLSIEAHDFAWMEPEKKKKEKATTAAAAAAAVTAAAATAETSSVSSKRSSSSDAKRSSTSSSKQRGRSSNSSKSKDKQNNVLSFEDYPPVGSLVTRAAASRIVSEAPECAFVLRVERFNWQTREKTVVQTVASHSLHTTVTLRIQQNSHAAAAVDTAADVAGGDDAVALAIQAGEYYRIVIDSTAGHYVSAYSADAFQMEHAIQGDGSIWHAQFPSMSSSKLHGAYTATPAQSWFVLFKCIVFVPDGSSNSKGSSSSRSKSEGKSRAAAATTATSATKRPEFFVSSLLHVQDRTIAPYVSLQWINNDTMESTPCAQLDSGAVRLQANTTGYTLMASCLSPHASPASKWSLALQTSEPFAAQGSSSSAPLVTQESVATFAEYSGLYERNACAQVLRVVCSNNSNSPSQLAVQLCVSDATAGLLCQVYPVPSALRVPLQTRCGLQTVLLPSLIVKKDKAYLIDVRLDALTKGTAVLSNKPLSWSLRIFSAQPCTVAVDRAKQDRYNALKTSWEKGQSGRAKKAKLARAKFLESKEKENSTALPLAATSPVSDAKSAASTQLSLVANAQLGQKHAVAMLRSRHIEAQAMVARATEREQTLKQWRDTQATESNGALESRDELRDVQMLQVEQLLDLQALIRAPFHTESSGGSSSSSSSSKQRTPDYGATTAQSEQALDAAIAKLAALPEWKAKSLCTKAIERSRVVCGSAIQLVLQYDADQHAASNSSDGKSSSSAAAAAASDKQNAWLEAQLASVLRTANACAHPCPKLSLWIAHGSQKLATHLAAELESCLAPGIDEKNTNALQDVRSFYDEINALLPVGVQLSASHTAVMQQADALLKQHGVEAPAADAQPHLRGRAGRKGGSSRHHQSSGKRSKKK
jgi:hypothetical protein